MLHNSINCCATANESLLNFHFEDSMKINDLFFFTPYPLAQGQNKAADAMKSTQQNTAPTDFLPDQTAQTRKTSVLQDILAVKAKSESDLSKITEKVEAYLALMLQNNESYSVEFEALQEAEIAAAELLDRAEDALVNYQPATAEEYGIQAIALVDSLLKNLDNPNYITAMKRGAAKLSKGTFQ